MTTNNFQVTRSVVFFSLTKRQLARKSIFINPLAAEEFFFIFFFENLIKNTYYWLDQRKKVKNAKKKF